MTVAEERPTDDWERELARARAFYDEGSENRPNDWYSSPFNLASAVQRHQVEAQLLRLLAKCGVRDMSGMRVADFGCGVGVRLEWFMDLGAARDKAYGIDLSASRVEAARKRLPLATVDVGPAHETSLAPGSCDIVAQFCVFSSIHNPCIRRAVAREMDRVLAPGGQVIWQDIRPPSPVLRGVYRLRRLVWWLLRGRFRGETLKAPRGLYVLLSRNEVADLFPGYSVEGGPVGLSRDVVSVRGRGTTVLSAIADLVPALRIYDVFLLTKPGQADTTGSA